MNFGVWKRNFVAQSEIYGEARRDFERVLRVRVDVVSAQAASEISAALQEENRLADQETCNRIRKRRVDEDEKSVGRNSLQHVDLIVAPAAAEFQFVTPVNPGERTVQVKSILVAVARAGDGIADRGKARRPEQREARSLLRAKANS